MRDAADSVNVPRSAFMRPPLVLAYHALGEVDPRHDPEGLVIRPAELRSQIERLLAREYEFVTIAAFARRLAAGDSIHGLCALTFDDGSLDNGTILPEILSTLGVPATLYVCPGLLGEPHPWIAPEAGFRLMNREELRAAAAHELVEIGSHTRTHVDMGAIADPAEAYAELRSSKLDLEEILDMPVESFAYPYGRYSAVCPAEAERAGYTSAATCEIRGGWTPYELRRELIAPGDLGLRFELKIRGLFRPLVSSPPARLRRHLLDREPRPAVSSS
jgi:peptidoglycan/xylan/chitin deacetylase (PgdA/CDA1 family)